MPEFSEDFQPDAAVAPIAVIGLACRFPGAPDSAAFWRNLVEGVESVRFFSRAEQREFGVPDKELDDPNFVPAAMWLDDYDRLDAALFGMTGREAEITDPQHRLFLELVHTTLEDAGYDPGRYDGSIGVYAGAGEDTYLWRHLRPNRKLMAKVGNLSVSLGGNPDYVATAVSYKLNLRGPALTVHTACSTSMVAVHLACEALRAGECDAALAGGVSMELPMGRGYVYQDGGITSADGHCYPFDARAAGTMWGSGGGVVLLKRLDDAIADGDHIRAVILADGINNDGATKVGFSAPSAEGQAELIGQVVGLAGVDPRSISYVEAHGTGTALGDPIEVSALSTVYGHRTAERGWCGIGSVKANIGHLSQAAGIAGLIKTVLALENGVIPPSINFERPNPAIDFADSPFYVVATPTTWEAGPSPRRAAVSSFGIGGTNAHVLVQEAPARTGQTPARPVRLLQLSARTATALSASAGRLAGHLRTHSEDLGDVAFTLRAGRIARQHRAFVVVSDVDDAVAALGSPKRLRTGEVKTASRLAFLFSGQGAQYPAMAAELYRHEPVFADALDACLAAVDAGLAATLRDLLLRQGDEERLRRTEFAQPALFAVEYALAALWRSWGIEPDAMLGHSVGEYVAATLAGVFEPAAAMRLVAVRGKLIQELPGGAMLAVQADEKTLVSLLPEGLSLAAVNGPGACVASGPTPLIEEFTEALSARGIGAKRLRTSHAFHSPMMRPVLAAFTEAVAAVAPKPPQRPLLSNVTGEWMTEAEATDPVYWARHLREAVRFGDCVATLLADGSWTLLECGPGRQLAGLARMQTPKDAPKPVHSLPGPGEKAGALVTLHTAAGELWLGGRELAIGTGRRVPLPTYPYERTRYWVERMNPSAMEDEPDEPRALPIEGWARVPVWRQLPPAEPEPVPSRCLVFAAPGLAEDLRAAGADVIEVHPAEDKDHEFAGDRAHRVRPGSRAGFDALIAALPEPPERIVFGWPLLPGNGGVARALDLGFYSLLALTQAITAALPDTAMTIDVLTRGTQAVLGGDLTAPAYATVSGIVRVIPREAPSLTLRHLDLDPAEPEGTSWRQALSSTELVALRNGRQWTVEYEAAPLPAAETAAIADRGVYVITGGLGGIGLSVAEDLAKRARARLVLVGRGGLPPRTEWDGALPDRQARAVAAIRRMEAAGAEVLVLAADVADPAAVSALREQALAAFGEVHGVIHAAGVAGGGMAEVKERAVAEAVLAPKVYGTLALHAAFGQDGLDFFALCSSITGVVGGFGQVDYCAANAFLDAYAHSVAAAGDRIVSLDWGGWLEVGMAVETDAPTAFRALGRRDGDDLADATPVDHPVISRARPATVDGPAVAEGWISADTHWVLEEHRVGGVPVMPGTGNLETIRAAFVAVTAQPSPGHVVELRDVAFLEPLAVPEGTRQRVRVRFDGEAFELLAGTGTAERVYVRGSAAWVLAEPSVPDIAAIRERTSPFVAPEAAADSELVDQVTFGPHWDCVTDIRVGDGEELGRFETADVAGWGMQPALLDMATVFVISKVQVVYLPFGYGRLTVHAPLDRPFHSHLRYRDTGTDEVMAADLTLVAEDGQVLVTISDFMLRRVDWTAVHEGIAETAPAPETVTGEAGIRPAEGAEALRRVLASSRLGRQVVLSAVPFDRVRAGVQRLTTDTVERELAGAAGPAGGTAADFVAPAAGTQEKLAKVWSEVLGADRVGATDAFFDLGGNSLVAVQLIARIREALDVRLPMRAIFEAPTVEGMAAWIDKLRGDGEPPAADPKRLDSPIPVLARKE